MYDVAKYGGQLTEFMKEKNIKPFSNMFPIMVQLPIFVSMFVGLRGLANLPLESMMHGGLFWFEDLTIADPFYLLPLMTSTSMFLQFKYAARSDRRSNLNCLTPTAIWQLFAKKLNPILKHDCS